MAAAPFVQPSLKEKDLKPGDHIYVWREGYHHHGIYEGNGNVIHWRGNKDLSKSGVIRTTLEQFRLGTSKNKYENRGIKRVRYGVSKLDESLKLTGGTCHSEKCDSIDMTLYRAREALKPENSFQFNGSNYKLFFRNCESFAVYCKLGYEKTGQGEFIIDKVVKKVVLPVMFPQNGTSVASATTNIVSGIISDIGSALIGKNININLNNNNNNNNNNNKKNKSKQKNKNKNSNNKNNNVGSYNSNDNSGYDYYGTNSDYYGINNNQETKQNDSNYDYYGTST